MAEEIAEMAEVIGIIMSGYDPSKAGKKRDKGDNKGMCVIPRSRMKFSEIGKKHRL